MLGTSTAFLHGVQNICDKGIIAHFQLSWRGLCAIYIYPENLKSYAYIYIYLLNYIIKIHITVFVKHFTLNYVLIHSFGAETSAEEFYDRFNTLVI